MSLLFILLSLLLLFVGAMLFHKPQGIISTVKIYADEVGLQVAASLGRILIGIALIGFAGTSNLPGLISLLGWVTLIAGVVFLFMPQAKFRDFILMALDKVNELHKVVGAIVVVIGLIVLYAFW